MNLTGSPLLWLTAGLTVAFPLTALLGWNWVRGPRVVKIGQRAGLLLSTQVVAVMLAFLAVNDQYQFFASWQDLLGSPSATPAIVPIGAAGAPGVASGPRSFASDRAAPPLGETAFRGQGSSRDPGGGTLLTLDVQGAASGLTEAVLVHLPAGYATSGRSYPVVELLPGWHSGPRSWVTSFHVLDVMATQQKFGNLGPVITVMPTMNVALPRDAECTDIPHGIKAETWLTTDVRNFMLSRYRALSAGRSWAVMGYSTGGYCAAKMQLAKPQWYPTAISLAGYFDAVKDNTTGDLWGGSTAVRNNNSLNWIVTHRPTPNVDLLVFTSREDKDSYGSSSHFLKIVKPPMRTYSLIVPRGGHNLKAVAQALPEVLTWIGQHLLALPGPGAPVS